jgi:hypothetical protein
MRVHIERDWSADRVRVYVARSGAAGDLRNLTIPPDGVGWLVEEVLEPGTRTSDIRPLLEIPVDVFEAIIAAGADVLPPDRTQAAHLADAIGVRDRLLALIERPTS